MNLVHDISSALEADGVDHPGVSQFAGLGSHGDCPRNVARDFERLAQKKGFIGKVFPDTEKISVEHNGKAELHDLNILAPSAMRTRRLLESSTSS